jgi:hypothetical protein
VPPGDVPGTFGTGGSRGHQKTAVAPQLESKKMTIQAPPLVAGAVAFLSMAGAGYTQDQTYPSVTELADMQAKVKVASGLIALGRTEQDPMMLLVAAKILSDVDAQVRDPGPDASGALDVATILGEAKSLAGGNQYLLDQIAAMPMERAERGRHRYCGWDYECGTFDCGWVYSCAW